MATLHTLRIESSCFLSLRCDVTALRNPKSHLPQSVLRDTGGSRHHVNQPVSRRRTHEGVFACSGARLSPDAHHGHVMHGEVPRCRAEPRPASQEKRIELAVHRCVRRDCTRRPAGLRSARSAHNQGAPQFNLKAFNSFSGIHFISYRRSFRRLLRTCALSSQ